MSDLQINRESLPERCEICHQVDCYDRYTNSCSRCKELSSNVPSQPTPKQSPQKYKGSRFWLLKHWFQVTILRFLGQHKIASIAASVVMITFALIGFFN